MLCKSFQVLVLCFIPFVFAFGQKLQNTVRRELEKNLVYPDKAIQEKESCIVLLKNIKNENGRDTLVLVNSVREYFREVVFNAMAKANTKNIFNNIDGNSIIIISFIYYDDNEFIGDPTAKFSGSNINDAVLKMRDNKNCIIYDPVIITGPSNSRVRH